MTFIMILLLSVGALNSIYGNILFGFIYIVFYQFLKIKKVLLNSALSINFWLLFLFGITYSLFGNFTIQSLEFYLVTPLITYSFGWILIELQKIDKNKFIKKIVFVMLVGFCIHAFLNYTINIGVSRWLLTDYFTGEIRAATGSAVLNTMIFSLLGYFLIIEKEKCYKIGGFILFFISCLYGFQLGSRTQFIIMGIVFAFIILLYLYEEKGMLTSFKAIITILICFGILFFLYNVDFLSMKTIIEKSNLITRIDQGGLEASDQYRIGSVFNGLISLMMNPFGGLQSDFYFHNMWLDVGRVAGIFPFIFLTLYTIIATIHVIKIFFNKNNDYNLRYMLLSLYLGILINFFTEPIMEGLLNFFLYFCLLSGIVDFLYISNKGV